MPKKTEVQVGKVFLRLLDEASGKWRASWVDPASKKHMRRVLPAHSFRDAKEQAEEINRQISAGYGFYGRQRGMVGHSVEDAIVEAVKHTDANDRSRGNYLSRANAFLDYLLNNVPGVKGWGDVTEQVLENYIEHCRKGDRSFDTVRQRLLVLRIASGYMSRTYPRQYRHVTAGLRLKCHHPPKAELEAKETILNPDQLRKLLTWLRENRPMIHCWAILQALCGVRLYEAAFLREQDINPQAGTITITETSVHKPKTRYSYREIPVCPAAIEALKTWIVNMKVRHPGGYLFFPDRRRYGQKRLKTPEAKAGVFTMDAITHFWGEAHQEARGKGIDLPSKFIPRKLRATFVTHLRKAGADFSLLETYIGHAPKTILAAHYDEIDLDRLRTLANHAQDLYQAQGAFPGKENKNTTGDTKPAV